MPPSSAQSASGKEDKHDRIAKTLREHMIVIPYLVWVVIVRSGFFDNSIRIKGVAP